MQNLWQFKSLLLRHKKKPIRQDGFLFIPEEGFEPSQMQHAGGMLLPPVQTLVATDLLAKPKSKQIPPSVIG